MNKDKLTYYISRAINFLLLYNPVGTSFGILLGTTVLGFQKIIASYFAPFGLIDWYAFITLGVLFGNIKPIITKKYLDPDTERQLVYIRQYIKEGKFTESEERAIWRKAINSIIEEYNHNTDSDNNLNKPTLD